MLGNMLWEHRTDIPRADRDLLLSSSIDNHLYDREYPWEEHRSVHDVVPENPFLEDFGYMSHNRLHGLKILVLDNQRVGFTETGREVIPIPFRSLIMHHFSIFPPKKQYLFKKLKNTFINLIMNSVSYLLSITTFICIWIMGLNLWSQLLQ